MANYTHVNVAGTWKKLSKIHINVAGTWKEVKNAYLNVGGTWKKIHAGAFEFAATIATNVQNYNVRAAAVSAGWNQVDPLLATITVNSGVYVGSASTGSFAFDTGVTFPAETLITLINNGYILGRGGAAALAGGPALRAQVAMNVVNNGTIGGGGGGGANGTSYSYRAAGAVNSDGSCSYTGCYYHGGTGGAGGTGAGNYTTSPTSGGGATYSSAGFVNWLPEGVPCDGSLQTCSWSSESRILGAAGGSGGALGTAAGGAAGACTSGNGFISWTTAGTRYGALN